jgi:hypothetical protein
MLAASVTGAPRFVMRAPRGAEADRRRRALALAHYTTAPLALILPGVLLVVGMPLLEGEVERGRAAAGPLPAPLLAVSVLGSAVLLAATVTTALCVGRWFRRVRHCGAGRAVLAVAECAGLCALSAIVLLGLTPWCIGFLWLAVDAFR